eukprot:gene20980-23818_t
MSQNKPNIKDTLGLADGLPPEILFACKKSGEETGQYYIPSHNNYVGETKLSNVIIRSGCSTNLFALDSNISLASVFDSYPCNDFSYSLEPNAGTNGGGLVLLIRGLASDHNFPVRIAVDVFDDYLEFFVARDRVLLKKLAAGTSPVPRMPLSLFGNVILDCFDIIKVGSSIPVTFFVNYGALSADTLRDLQRLAIDVHSVLGKMDQETVNALHKYDPSLHHGRYDPAMDF